MAKKKPEGFDLGRMFADGIRKASEKSNLYGYTPHPKQILFHSSAAKERLFVGGNRSGKTVAASVEDIYRLRGESPFQPVKPAPVQGRIVGVDFDNGVEKILKPMIQRWIPPSLLINGSWEDSYDKGLRVLNCANGSSMEFMSYIQDVPKFAGTSRDFVHFDEEPPESIYEECKLRTLDVNGVLYISMTPLDGMDWSYDKLFIPGTGGPGGLMPINPRIEVFEVDVAENPYVPTEEIEEFLEGMSPEMKAMRKSGQYVHIGGMAFKKFGPHCIVPYDSFKIQDLRGWDWYSSMDHGLKNPTCWLWHAVEPGGGGRILTFAEHYQNEWVVKQHAAKVKEMEAEFGKIPEIRVGDPAIQQRNGETGHSIHTAYAQEGIYIALANNDVRSSVDRINDYIDPRRPRWFIADNCVNLMHELRRARWKVNDSAKVRAKQNPMEELVKKDDHSVDAARYFFSFMPDLEPVRETKTWERARANVDATTSAVSSFVHPRGIMIDVGFLKEPQETEWTAVDESVGPF